MIDYKGLIHTCRAEIYSFHACQVDEVLELLRDCRDTLCGLCGNYLEADKKICKGCRWRDE